MHVGPLTTTKALWAQRRDVLKLAVPAFCYTLQQNLLILSATYISAPALQALGQTKTIFTAVLAMLVLKRKFTRFQWLSFFLLVGGVILVEHQDESSQSEELVASGFDRFIGVTTSIVAAFLSGFAGIFLERNFTTGNTSIWAKNFHLAIASMPFQLFLMVEFDRTKIIEDGAFHGFHADTLLVIFLVSFGGLLTGVVIKYAGNILKSFAGALAILLTDFVAMALFAYKPTGLFWIGMVGVCTAVTMYGLPADVQQSALRFLRRRGDVFLVPGPSTPSLSL